LILISVYSTFLQVIETFYRLALLEDKLNCPKSVDTLNS